MKECQALVQASAHGGISRTSSYVHDIEYKLFTFGIWHFCVLQFRRKKSRGSGRAQFPAPHFLPLTWFVDPILCKERLRNVSQGPRTLILHCNRRPQAYQIHPGALNVFISWDVTWRYDLPEITEIDVLKMHYSLHILASGMKEDGSFEELIKWYELSRCAMVLVLPCWAPWKMPSHELVEWYSVLMCVRIT